MDFQNNKKTFFEIIVLIDRYKHDEIKFSYLATKLKKLIMSSEMPEEKIPTQIKYTLCSLETRRVLLGNDIPKKYTLKDLDRINNFFQKIIQ
jgi:hypothetical protein